MVADISNPRTPGYDVNIKMLKAINRRSIPVNLVLPPYVEDSDPSPILETPNVLLPSIVLDYLKQAEDLAKTAKPSDGVASTP